MSWDRGWTGTPPTGHTIADALMAAVSLVWISLAVSVIRSEDDPASLMYAGVLAVGLLGAVVLRFRAISDIPHRQPNVWSWPEQTVAFGPDYAVARSLPGLAREWW